MFEWTRNYLTGRSTTLRENVNGYKGQIMTKPLRRLDREIKKNACWTSTYACRLTFQVTHVLFTDSFVLDLEKHTFSCNYWKLVAIPCKHGMTAIHRKVDDPIKYVHKCYHISTYEKCYSEAITPLNGHNKWPRTSNPIMLPHLFKHGPWRPKKLRRGEPDEVNQTKLKGTKTSHRCKRYFELGHNKRTCKKNKQIVLVPSGNTAHANQEMPTQASQELPTHAIQTRP